MCACVSHIHKPSSTANRNRFWWKTYRPQLKSRWRRCFYKNWTRSPSCCIHIRESYCGPSNDSIGRRSTPARALKPQRGYPQTFEVVSSVRHAIYFILGGAYTRRNGIYFVLLSYTYAEKARTREIYRDKERERVREKDAYILYTQNWERPERDGVKEPSWWVTRCGGEWEWISLINDKR